MPLQDLPQSNRQHAVPQNIMDVEFKLIGDLTLRQFIYLLLFGGLAYVSSVVLVGVFKWPLVAVLALTGVGLAFVPVQERGLDEWIANFVRAIYSPTQRIWYRELTLPSAFMHDYLAVVKQELITLAPTSSRRRLEEYLEYKAVDQKVDPLDIPVHEYIQKVRNAYADYTPEPSSVSVGVLEPEAPVFEEPTFEEIPPKAPQPEEKAEEKPAEKPMPAVPAETAAKPAATVTPVAPPAAEAAPKPITPPAPKPEPVRTSVAAPTPKPQETVRKVVQAPQGQPSPAFRRQQETALRPMTPDMHSGRRFVNLVPKSGELILPIRGERVLKTSEEEEIETDIQEKAEKLKQLLAQIKQEELGAAGRPSATKAPSAVGVAQPAAQPAVAAPTDVNVEASTLVEKLKVEHSILSEEISKLQSQKETASDAAERKQKEEMIQRLEKKKERTQSDFEALQQQLVDFQTKLKEKISAPFAGSSKTPLTPAYNPIQNLSMKTNIITGLVKANDGTVIENALLIVKNAKGESVRAFKSDKLGQFKLTTPVPNGTYTIEVIANNKNQTFDIISIEAKGELLPAVEMVGKG